MLLAASLSSWLQHSIRVVHLLCRLRKFREVELHSCQQNELFVSCTSQFKLHLNSTSSCILRKRQVHFVLPVESCQVYLRLVVLIGRPCQLAVTSAFSTQTGAQVTNNEERVSVVVFLLLAVLQETNDIPYFPLRVQFASSLFNSSLGFCCCNS